MADHLQFYNDDTNNEWEDDFVFEERPEHKIIGDSQCEGANDDINSDDESDWNTDLRGSADNGSDCSFVTYHLSHITNDKISGWNDSLLNTLFSGTNSRTNSRNDTSAHLFQKQFLVFDDIFSRARAIAESADSDMRLPGFSVTELLDLLTHLKWSRVISHCHIHPDMMSSPVFYKDLQQHRLDPLLKYATNIRLHLRRGDGVALFSSSSEEVNVPLVNGHVLLSPARVLILSASDVSRHLANCIIFEDMDFSERGPLRSHLSLFVDALLATIELEFLSLELLCHIDVPFSKVKSAGFYCAEKSECAHHIDDLLFMQRYKDTANISIHHMDTMLVDVATRPVECFHAASTFLARYEQLYELVKFSVKLIEHAEVADQSMSEIMRKANCMMSKIMSAIFMSSVNISSFAFTTFPPRHTAIGAIDNCDVVYSPDQGDDFTVASRSYAQKSHSHDGHDNNLSSSLPSLSNSAWSVSSATSSEYSLPSSGVSDSTSLSDTLSWRSDEGSASYQPPRQLDTYRIRISRLVPDVRALLKSSGYACLPHMHRAELKLSMVLLIRVGLTGSSALLSEDVEAVSALLDTTPTAMLSEVVSDLLQAPCPYSQENSYSSTDEEIRALLNSPLTFAALHEILTVLKEESGAVVVKPVEIELALGRVTDICMMLLSFQNRRKESMKLCKAAVLMTSDFSETEKCIAYCERMLEFLDVSGPHECEWSSFLFVYDILASQYQKSGNFENAISSIRDALDQIRGHGREFAGFQRLRVQDNLHLKLCILQMQCGKLVDASIELQNLLFSLQNRGERCGWEHDKVAVLSWMVEVFMKLGNSDRCRKLLGEMKRIRQQMEPVYSHLSRDRYHGKPARNTSISQLSGQSKMLWMRLDANLPRFALSRNNLDFGELTSRWYFTCKMYVSALKSLIPTLLSVELSVSADNKSHDKLKELARLYYLRGKIQLGAAISGKVKFPFSIGSNHLFTAVSLLFQFDLDNSPQQNAAPKHHTFFSKYYQRKQQSSIDLSAPSFVKPACKYAIRYSCMAELLADAAKWFKRAWDIFREVNDLVYSAKSAALLAKSQLQGLFVPCLYNKVPLETAVSAATRKRKKKKAPPKFGLGLDLDLEEKSVTSTSAVCLADIERTLFYCKEALLASHYPIEVMDFSLSQAELKMLQGREGEAVALWREVHEVFCSLFVDGLVIPLLPKISLSDSQIIFALLTRMTRFLLACDKRVINENVAFLDLQLNVSFDMERRYHRSDTTAKIAGAYYDKRDKATTAKSMTNGFLPNSDILRTLDHMAFLEQFPRVIMKYVISDDPSLEISDDNDDVLASAVNILEEEPLMEEDEIFAMGGFGSSESPGDDRQFSWRSLPHDSLKRNGMQRASDIVVDDDNIDNDCQIPLRAMQSAWLFMKHMKKSSNMFPITFSTKLHFHKSERDFSKTLKTFYLAMKMHRQYRKQIKIADINFDKIMKANMDNQALVGRLKQSVYIVQIDNILAFYHPCSGNGSFKTLSDRENTDINSPNPLADPTTLDEIDDISVYESCLYIGENPRSYLFDMMLESVDAAALQGEKTVTQANTFRSVLHTSMDFLVEALSESMQSMNRGSELDAGESNTHDVLSCTIMCSNGPHLLPWELLNAADSPIAICRRLSVCSLILQYANSLVSSATLIAHSGSVIVSPAYLTFRNQSDNVISSASQKSNNALRAIFALNLGVRHIIGTDQRPGPPQDKIPLKWLCQLKQNTRREYSPLSRMLKRHGYVAAISRPRLSNSREYKGMLWTTSRLCLHPVTVKLEPRRFRPRARWTDRVVSLDIQQDIVHRSMGSGGKSQLALFSDASRLLLNAPPVYTSDNATTQNSFPYIHFHLVFASFGDLTTLNESLVPLISTCGGPCQIQHSCRVVIFIPKYCIVKVARRIIEHFEKKCQSLLLLDDETAAEKVIYIDSQYVYNRMLSSIVAQIQDEYGCPIVAFV